MNRAFRPYFNKFVVVFIADIVVYSSDKEEHIQHITIVSQTWSEHDMYDKLKNVSFDWKKSSFWGMWYRRRGLK